MNVISTLPPGLQNFLDVIARIRIFYQDENSQGNLSYLPISTTEFEENMKEVHSRIHGLAEDLKPDGRSFAPSKK